MKHTTLITLTLTLVLAACGGSATPAPASAPDTYARPNLDTTYEGALAARNQLALGTLELDGASNAITPEQATTLLPLWQALLSTQKTGAAAQAEVSALLTQIESAMTAEQLTTLREMQLTQTDLQGWAKANAEWENSLQEKEKYSLCTTAFKVTPLELSLYKILRLPIPEK